MADYDSSLYAVPIGAPVSCKINGCDIREFGIELTEYPNIFVAPTRSRVQVVDGRAGSRDLGSVYDNWNFDLKGSFRGLSHDDFVEKRDLFVRWMDLQQHRTHEWFVGQESVRALKFELSGHKYWYDTGTVAVINGNDIVTGGTYTKSTGTTDGTTANKLVDSGATFQTDDVQVGDSAFNTTDNTAAVITAVDSETQLSLSEDKFVSGEDYIVKAHPKWKSFLSPNSEFRINSDHVDRYTIAEIPYESQLRLSGNVTHTTSLTHDYQAERHRYLLVNYEGTSGMQPNTQASFRTSVFNFTMGLRTVYPFWIGDIIECKKSSISAGDFVEMFGVGTTLHNPIYKISDSATNPEISVCDFAFEARFDGDVNARNTTNKADITPSEAITTFHFQPSRNGKGIYMEGGDSASYTSCPVNPSRFSFNIRFEAKFGSEAGGSDKYLFNYCHTGGNDGFVCFYDASDCDWVFGIQSGGATDVTTRTTAMYQHFVSGNYLQVGGWYDYEGRVIEGTRYYSKLFVNGIEVASTTAAITRPANTPTCPNIGHFSSTLEAYCTIDEASFFNVALSDREIIKLHTADEPLKNTNSTISYTGSLSANDILTIDNGNGQIEFYDDSQVSETSAAGNISGRNPSIRGNEEDEMAVLYFPAAITTLRVIYRPHYA